MIVISRSVNPFVNIAIEKWITDHVVVPSLYLWKNKTCVVVGRFQNPWKECNVTQLLNENVPLVRRLSGGGTVYHDSGNSLYSVFLNRNTFSRSTATDILACVLQRFGIPAFVNERFDVVVEGCKVSGSAYRLTSNCALHHGTLLINSNMDRMQKYLSKPNTDLMQCTAVRSVPSKVCNLSKYGINHDIFCNEMIKEFSKRYNICEKLDFDDLNVNKEIEETAALLQSTSHIYGSTPKFSNEVHIATRSENIIIALTCVDGVIETISSNSLEHDQFLKYLIGEYYHPIGLQKSWSLYTRSNPLTPKIGEFYGLLSEGLFGKVDRLSENESLSPLNSVPHGTT